jgi:alkanesulfonate monooxygenase SsuD/methylene tetrahydromethanopterin reductase-like flavin-dependent oxidoreductase (luciferase family)
MARTYIGNYWHTVIDHYNLDGAHFAQTKGYEYYGKMASQIEKAGADGTVEFFVNLQVWGTPEQCYDKILDIRSKVGCDAFNGVFSYGGMPYEEAERNLRLFARAVRPQLQHLDTQARA